MKPKFQIINHGLCHCQYFQGCGTSFTSFEHVVTGVGDNAKEAYEDAVEGVAQSTTSEQFEKLHLPTRPCGIRVRDKVPAGDEDAYWSVSIRYNVEN